MSQRQNSGASAQKLTILPLSCTLPPPSIPPGVNLTADERKHFRSIYKGPSGHYLDDSHAHEVAVYVKLTTAVLSGQGSAWQASERAKLAIQMGFTPASMRALGFILEGSL